MIYLTEKTDIKMEKNCWIENHKRKTVHQTLHISSLGRWKKHNINEIVDMISRYLMFGYFITVLYILHDSPKDSTSFYDVNHWSNCTLPWIEKFNWYSFSSNRFRSLVIIRFMINGVKWNASIQHLKDISYHIREGRRNLWECSRAQSNLQEMFF